MQWLAQVLNTLVPAVQAAPLSYNIRNAFELAWLASHAALRLNESDGTFQQFFEQHEPVWSTVMMYLGVDHIKPTASYTRLRWFSAFERMLVHTEVSDGSEKLIYLRGKATCLIDRYIVKSLPDWKEFFEYEYLFAVAHAHTYPHLRSYILAKHPSIEVLA